MSKRRGTMVTFEELLEEVGSDATRFILLSRSSDQEVDFDIELARRQSSDNPVYYVPAMPMPASAPSCARVPGCGGRARGVRRHRRVGGPPGGGQTPTWGCSPIPPSSPWRAISPTSATWWRAVPRAPLAPFRLTYYATELAAAFHAFYTNCHVLGGDAESDPRPSCRLRCHEARPCPDPGPDRCERTRQHGPAGVVVGA